MTLSSSKGMTLIEVMVVILIAIILTTTLVCVAVAFITSFRQQAEYSEQLENE